LGELFFAFYWTDSANVSTRFYGRRQLVMCAKPADDEWACTNRSPTISRDDRAMQIV